MIFDGPFETLSNIFEFLDIIDIFSTCCCNKTIFAMIDSEQMWQCRLSQLVGPNKRHYNHYFDLAKECVMGKLVLVNNNISVKLYPWETHKSLYDRLSGGGNSLISFSMLDNNYESDNNSEYAEVRMLIGLYWEGEQDLPVSSSLSDTYLIDDNDYGENLYKNVTHIDISFSE